jgi:hypothetical protein
MEVEEMSAHTPGPWEIVREDDGRFIDIVDVNGDGILSTLRNRNAESAANIHLLATAPDLLAALKTATENSVWRHASFCKCEVCEQVRAAIAKAEGQS